MHNILKQICELCKAELKITACNYVLTCSDKLRLSGMLKNSNINFYVVQNDFYILRSYKDIIF